MVIPKYQDGKTDEAFILHNPYVDLDLLDNAASRKAGGQELQKLENAQPLTSKIVVDMREFRSDLPCLIHKRGIEVVPVTITVWKNYQSKI